MYIPSIEANEPMERQMKQAVRITTAYALSPALMLTGFRFSKDYRWGASRFHRAVYACVDTVAANWIAGL